MTSSATRYKTLRSALLVALCALVFFFAWHAKTAVYSGGGPAKATPSTASKLWLNSEKLGVHVIDPTSGLLFWIAVLSLCSVYQRREPLPRLAYLTPPPNRLTLCDRHLFLRPPPVQA